MRVLIVKTTSMGDVIHTLPAISDIRRARPDASIDWLVEDSFAALPRLHPAVARVLPVAVRRWRKSLFSPATWAAVRAARAAAREFTYDLVIDCQGLVKSAWLARWAHGPRWGLDAASAREPLAARFYQHRVAVDRRAHAIERTRALVAAAIGVAHEGPPRFALAVPPLTQPALQQLTAQPYAVLLTNASRATKLWPAERWRAVEAQLAGRGLKSLLFAGSKAEQAATAERAAGMRNAHLAPPTSLDQLTAVLAGARIVVGLDTGLSHLAAAVGARTLGIYCDYDPALVGITGDAPCLSLGGVSAAPSAAEVIAGVAQLLADGPA
jgi:heptosyltransferase I